MERLISMNKTENPPYLSFCMVVILGLFPGIIILLVIFALSNPYIGPRLPLFLSVMLAIIFALVPTELGIIKYHSHKENKKFMDMICFKENTPIKRLLLFIIIPFLIAGIIAAILPGYEHKIWKILDFVPDWFRLDKVNFKEMRYLSFALVLAYIFNGFVGPIVEELYFRGFLLPRMQKLGKLAPLINVILFSLYHLFTPWENITRILSMTPIVYSVWINKNIKIGMIIHCSLNIIGLISTTIMISELIGG
jgi:membrane protease YdiL (CAAX protease family)